MIEFKLDGDSGVPFYRQVVDQIRLGIATGELSAGEQLPTVRALAVQLQINLNTVSKSYKELEIQNVLYTQQGTGTFISSSAVALPEAERAEKLKAITQTFINAGKAYGFTREALMRQLQTEES